MPKPCAFHILVDGTPLHCAPGQTVAGALLANRIYAFRTSPNGALPRGAFCMMGACQECAVHIDGVVRRACQAEVTMGMRVELRGAGTARAHQDSSAQARADTRSGRDHDI